MANVCDNCGAAVYRTRFVGGKFVGIDCRCLRAQQIKNAVSAFGNMTLDHVHDESGKPVRVTSMRQLSEAEQRYNFASAVLSYDDANLDSPPQQPVFKVSDVYKAKFSGRRV